MKTTAASVRDAFKYLFPDELPALQHLVRMLPNNPLVVNIGAGSGTSGLAILEARPDVKLVTIDITDESSPFGCLEGERQVVREAGLDHLWGTQWFQLHYDSVEAGMTWLEEANKDLFRDHRSLSIRKVWASPVDMVFVDGDHSYEHARDDIQIWMRALKQNGILVVHDYLKENIAPNLNGPHPQHWPGVDRAVQENLIGKFEQILHVDSLIAFRINLYGDVD